MKKIVMALLLIVSMMCITKNVYAEETYYTSPNGIELTREEYEFIVAFYGEGYLDIMTRDMYDEFVEDDLINSDVQYVTYNEPQLGLLNPGISPDSTIHSTSAKTVQIGRACTSTYCVMTLKNTWHGSPAIRSWDNIGAYLYNVSLIQHNATYVHSTAGTTSYSNLVTDTDGIGNSVELPATGEDIVITMTFKVTRGGTVFGSYQHAMQNTTLANSQNYGFSINGYGGVFDYTGNAIGIYDGMNGVDINV
jgi:hypothetical protein